MLPGKILLWVLGAAGLGAAQEAPAAPSIAEFAARRQALAKSLGEGVTVLRSKAPRRGFEVEWETDPGPKSGANFFYLVGRRYAGAALVLSPPEGRAVLFADPAAVAREETGIEDVRPLSELGAFLEAQSSDGMRVFREDRGKSDPDGRALLDAAARLRQIKSSGELVLMRRAARATSAAHIKAMQAARVGMNEADLERVFRAVLVDEGCDGLAYPPIVGGSRNTPVIHYTENNKPIADGELVLNDSAGSWRGYACDVTRTWPINGTFSLLQRRQYQAVLEAQKAAEALLRPGAAWADLSHAAEQAIARSGFGAVSFAKIHGLGHFVGLQTHDVGVYREPLQAGMVITIEPGIYDRANMTSIRIEDVYYVTPQGFERLSDGAPREIAQIERLIQNSY